MDVEPGLEDRSEVYWEHLLLTELPLAGSPASLAHKRSRSQPADEAMPASPGPWDEPPDVEDDFVPW